MKPFNMKIASIPVLIIAIFHTLSLSAFEDVSHFSKIFKETRHFRVFTPPGYDPSDTVKRYPVIYYFHGCRGSYDNSGVYKYSTWKLEQPEVTGRPDDPAYEYPNNADFENYTYHHEVIIISADGKIEGLDGCGVYFPSMSSDWEGNYYNFSAYIRELVAEVDKRFHTRPEPRYRAITGLSMGGHTAVWLAASNPHLFRSASHFGFAPCYYDIGDPEHMTTIDLKEMWRNLRGVPFRHSTNDRDYLRYYTTELFEVFSGAGFSNEYYLADFCRHWAARVDLQLDFHMRTFEEPAEEIRCFSFLHSYPSFEIRGYEVTSEKTGNGWIYLRDVTKNGFGLYTRKRLPWGGALQPFEITMTTPALYYPRETYTIHRYAYATGSFSTEKITADEKGRLRFLSQGAAGEETGIAGRDLPPAVVVLTDTINENIVLENNRKTSLAFDVVNLSDEPQTVNFIITTENPGMIILAEETKEVIIEALSKKRIHSLVTCTGRIQPDQIRNTGYIKISSSINGAIQDREHIIQVNIMNPEPEIPEVMVFDGRSEEVSLFRYAWGDWKDQVYPTAGVIAEGLGNGNGRAEAGELFSVWINPGEAFDEGDSGSWHPAVPLNGRNHPDVSVEGIMQYEFSTGRKAVSALMRLNRVPVPGNPVRIPFRTRFLKIEPLENSCHRNTADNFRYADYHIVIHADGIAEVEEQTDQAQK